MELRPDLPSLIVGFDTETTGLDTKEDEVISYGFAVFRHGRLASEESGQIFATTDRSIHPKAQEVHGLSIEGLRTRQSELGGPFSASEGLQYALRQLEKLRDQNAVFVGAFPKFDFDMIESMSRRHLGIQPSWSREIYEDFRFPEYFIDREPHAALSSTLRRSEPLLMSSAASGVPATSRELRRRLATDMLMSSKKRWPRIIDVCAFDRLHWPDISRRRGLGALCDFYGVEPGRHDALQDARAAVEVWMCQMQRRFREYSSSQ